MQTMRLLGFSGKKQSGKDSAARFIIANANAVALFNDDFEVTVETFYFAEPIKDFAKTFGIDHELLWGNDKQKNTLIHIRWGQLPHWEKLCQKKQLEFMRAHKHSMDFYCWKDEQSEKYLTVREFLQQVGEEMFLAMDPDHWLKPFREKMLGWHHLGLWDVAIVADIRKPEQVKCVQEMGGKVIHFLRDHYKGEDRHLSETALDKEKFPHHKFDSVIDNRELTLTQTHKRVLKCLRTWGWVRGKINLSLINWEPK